MEWRKKFLKKKITHGKIHTVPFSRPLMLRAPADETCCVAFLLVGLFVCLFVHGQWKGKGKRSNVNLLLRTE